MKKTISIFLIFISITTAQKIFSQEQNIDSLAKKALKYKYTKPQIAIAALQEIYTQSIQKKDTVKAINSIIDLSYIYSHNVNYPKAYDGYWKALLLTEKIKNEPLKSKIYQELGWLYSFYDRDKEALKYFNLALTINKKLYKNKKIGPDYLTSDYFAFINFYRIRENKDLFKIYLDSAMITSKLPYHGANKNYLNAEIAYQLANEKKYETSLQKLDSVKNYFSNNSDNKPYLVVIDYIIGDVYKKMGNLKKSKEAYLESLSYSEKNHSHTNYKMMSCNALVEIYKVEHNYKKAFEYLNKAKKQNDSVFGSRSKNNQHLFNVKDTYRITKEQQLKTEQEHRLKQLEQEDYIWFLKYVILITSIIFILIFSFLFTRNLRTKHQSEKKIMQERQQHELKAKNEILELKNKELTSSALQLIEKEEFLNNLKEKLSKQKEGNIDIKVINRIVNTIQGNPTSNWKEFEARFTSINQSFYNNLKEKFPKLGQTDQKICALIKLNFSSKEMSSLLGISVESVHTSRYRLRKKLGLKRNESLIDFINSI